MASNSKSIGDCSEAICLAKFLEKGWVVLTPFGDNQRYDFVIDRGNGFERVQVKTGRIKEGCIKFQACSNTGYRGAKRTPYQGQIEYFAVFCPDIKTVYLVPVGNLKKEGTLRIEEPKIKKHSRIVFAKDYEI